MIFLLVTGYRIAGDAAALVNSLLSLAKKMIKNRHVKRAALPGRVALGPHAAAMRMVTSSNFRSDR